MVIRRHGSAVYYTNFVVRGRRIRVSTGTTDKELAEQYEARLKQQAWNETHLGVRQPRSWKEAVVRYSEEKTAKRTLNQDLDRLVKLTPWLENVPLHQITNATVNDALAAYQGAALAANKRRWKTNRKMTPASRNRYRAVVQHLLNLAAVEWEWIERAPKIRRESEHVEEARWLTPQEAERLLAACTGPRAHWRAPIALALSTGLRAGNIFGLRWRWVDIPRRVIVVPKAKAKAGRTIAVPLNDTAVAVLEGERGKHPDFVFTHRGQPMTRINPARFTACCEELGIEGATFHSLRHTWAAWHIMAGTPLYDLMVMGGWTSLAMLQKTYGHLSTAHLAESANRLVGTNLVTAVPGESDNKPVSD